MNIVSVRLSDVWVFKIKIHSSITIYTTEVKSRSFFNDGDRILGGNVENISNISNLFRQISENPVDK